MKVILLAKMGLFGNNKELQFRTSKLQQKPLASPTIKQEESYFMEKRDVGKGSSEQKLNWSTSKVKGDDGFSLAELLELWISYRRGNVYLSYWAYHW